MDKTTQQALLNLVKRNYEDIAVEFDNTRKKQLWPELVKLAGLVKTGDKVLDVGCGNGRLAGAFNGQEISYLGIDSSRQLIDEAGRHPKLLIGDKKFLLGDALELDRILENNFDYVFCVAVIHHLPGKDLRVRALEQMKHKLKPGGKIIISVWNLWAQKKFSRLIFKYGWLKLIGKHKMDFNDILFDWKNNLGQPVSRRYYHVFTKIELQKIFKQAGLKLSKLYKDQYNYYAILSK